MYTVFYDFDFLNDCKKFNTNSLKGICLILSLITIMLETQK